MLEHCSGLDEAGRSTLLISVDVGGAAADVADVAGRRRSSLPLKVYFARQKEEVHKR